MPSPSYVENADGYPLTVALMHWFWDLYCDPAQRAVVTAEFDPLRDEGTAYAQVLRAAGVPVLHVAARGHTHTSLTMVDVVLSGAPVREEIALRLRAMFREPVTV